MPRIRVLVIDDSAFARRLLIRILSRDPCIEVVGAAPDAASARQEIRRLAPDVLTLDLEMPGMDGLTFLSNLMRLRPMRVVVISSLTTRGAEATLRALELGAIEVIGKPLLEDALAFEEHACQIIDKVKAAAGARPAGPRNRERPAAGQEQQCLPRRAEPVQLVVLGASTGGTEAIRAIVTALPRDAIPMLAVQHLPAPFSAAFAEALDEESRVRVREARDALEVRRGEVLIARAGSHLVLARCGSRLVCRLSDAPAVNRYRPSVDVLFRSVARTLGARALGALLTGMGDDGARGLLELREAGAHTLAQDRETSVVWGMPGRAVELGAAERVLPLDRIAEAILNLTKNAYD